MLAHLADVSIRSLVAAIAAAVILWMLRKRQTAALRHAVWAAVVCGMLALFAFGEALPRLPVRILRSPRASTEAPARNPARLLLSDAALPSSPAAPPSARRPIGWRSAAMYAYSAVALAFLAQFVTGLFLVRKLLRTARPVSADAGRQGGEVVMYESERIAVPFTVGWLRPVILLPLEWREWDSEKLEAVMAHEGAHARRRDGLAAALAGVNRCLFWFHPLAWMLERKLALLAEQACDDSCVVMLGDGRRYARLLLEMASVLDGSEGRLRGHALTMAGGSHIGQRIDSLLQEGRTFSRGLSRTAWVAVALCGVPLVWGAGAVELDQQAAALAPQADSAPTPTFKTATIRPCAAGDGAGIAGRGGAKGRGMSRSPGKLYVHCMSVAEMINHYFTLGSDPLINDSMLPFDAQRIRGGPSWVGTDFYTIDATTDDPAANGPTVGPSPASRLMMGPMLMALIEERFRLKTHLETEDVPMYALTVAAGGLKLKPMEQGGCVPRGEEVSLKPTDPGFKPPCGWTGWGTNGPNRTMEGGGVPLSRFAEDLGDLFMDRHVLDETGVAGVFNIHLEYLPDEHTHFNLPIAPAVDPSSNIPRAAPIFAALEQQLGLTLVPRTGPHGFMVIDRVERPAGN